MLHLSLYTSLYGLHLRMWEYCPYSDMWLQRAEGSHVLDKNDLVIIVNLEYIKLIIKIKINLLKEAVLHELIWGE